MVDNETNPNTIDEYIQVLRLVSRPSRHVAQLQASRCGCSPDRAAMWHNETSATTKGLANSYFIYQL